MTFEDGTKLDEQQTPNAIAKLPAAPSHKVDFNGHFLAGNAGVLDSAEFHDGWLARKVKIAVEQIQSMGDGWHEDMETCSECGEHLRLRKHGDHYQVLTRVITGQKMYRGIGMLPVFESRNIPCKYPDGVTPFEVTIQVPSGKLALFNFLVPGSDPVPQARMYELDINTSAGMLKYTEEYAKHNILYAYCGNTSVQAYRTREGVDFRHSSEFDAEGNDVCHPTPIGKSVSCRVWWFTALDLDELKRLYQTDKPEERFEDLDSVVLDVEPGSYAFTMDYGAKLRYRVLASGKRVTL